MDQVWIIPGCIHDSRYASGTSMQDDVSNLIKMD